MCRIAAYVGVPRTLDALLYAAPRSLHEQAYAPAQQTDGTVNVDGTGVAWWPDDAPGPLRYATTLPPWSDENLRELAPYLHARAMVAAVRGATPGVGGGRDAVAPFTVGDLAVAHNGWIGGFHALAAPRLVGDLPAAWVGGLGAMSDSLLITLHLAARRATTSDLVEAVADTLGYVASVCRATRQPATLNLVVSDGQRIVASRASVARPTNSLYVLTDGESPWSDGALVASEPLDDRPWQPVPGDHLVEVVPGRCRSFPLDLGVTP